MLQRIFIYGALALSIGGPWHVCYADHNQAMTSTISEEEAKHRVLSRFMYSWKRSEKNKEKPIVWFAKHAVHAADDDLLSKAGVLDNQGRLSAKGMQDLLKFAQDFTQRYKKFIQDLEQNIPWLEAVPEEEKGLEELRGELTEKRADRFNKFIEYGAVSERFSNLKAFIAEVQTFLAREPGPYATRAHADKESSAASDLKLSYEPETYSYITADDVHYVVLKALEEEIDLSPTIVREWFEARGNKNKMQQVHEWLGDKLPSRQDALRRTMGLLRMGYPNKDFKIFYPFEEARNMLKQFQKTFAKVAKKRDILLQELTRDDLEQVKTIAKKLARPIEAIELFLKYFDYIEKRNGVWDIARPGLFESVEKAQGWLAKFQKMFVKEAENIPSQKIDNRLEDLKNKRTITYSSRFLAAYLEICERLEERLLKDAESVQLLERLRKKRGKADISLTLVTHDAIELLRKHKKKKILSMELPAKVVEKKEERASFLDMFEKLRKNADWRFFYNDLSVLIGKAPLEKALNKSNESSRDKRFRAILHQNK